jgi:hypothetical protein
MRSITAGAVLAALLAAPAIALGGPPFQTDDPEPVELGHYEFYVFSNVDRTPSEVDPAGPAFEFNWGALPDTQLHVVLGFGAIVPTDDPASSPASSPSSAAPSGAPSVYGLLDTEIGVKYRFLEQTKTRPEIGTFPMIEVPTGSYSRGLGVGHAWYKLPLWIQKDWGPWTTYGGAGYAVVPQRGYRDFSYAGWLLQRDVGERWTLGGEVWHHGAEGPATPLDHPATMIDLGGYHYFRKPAFQLLFCLGHSVAGHSETYGYLGLYWTWGKKESGSDSHASAAPGWSFTERPSLALARP